VLNPNITPDRAIRRIAAPDYHLIHASILTPHDVHAKAATPATRANAAGEQAAQSVILTKKFVAGLQFNLRIMG